METRMSKETPRYVIFVDEGGEEETMMVAPVAKADREYFLKAIVGTVRPLSEHEYENGIALILHTLARSSYILYKDEIYWCIEWQPGLIAVRFSPTGLLAWTALRSPVPNFGGRTPTKD